MEWLKTIFEILFPSIKKYFEQPKVHILLQEPYSSQRNKGISRNNTTEYINHPNTIFDYELAWVFKLTLRNNSECTAYNIKLIKPQSSVYGGFFLSPKIDSLEPLQPNNEKSYTKAKFSEVFTGTKNEMDKKFKEGSHLLNQFILEYTNLKGRKFYTYFNYKAEEDKRNIFSHSFPHSLVSPQEKVLYSKKD